MLSSRNTGAINDMGTYEKDNVIQDDGNYELITASGI